LNTTIPIEERRKYQRQDKKLQERIKELEKKRQELLEK
jgi:hypothetical protein